MTANESRTPQVVGRFAPSPSGPMHLGNARTAMLAWLDVRARGGSMLLRIEDLDRERCRPEHVALVRRDLAWLGLDWDAETPAQSLRDDAYSAAIDRLAGTGLIYPCFCSRRDRAVASAPHGGGEAVYPGTCRGLDQGQRDRLIAEGRRPALRVMLPDSVVSVADRVNEGISQLLATDVGDIIVRRSDGLYAYQLAVVVDDATDGVTDVVRGDDLVASAPRQVALQQLLGLPTPTYAHVPLVLGDDGERLAKRHGAVSLAELRDRGVTPSQVVGRLAEISGLGDGAPLSVSDLVAGFRLERVSNVAARLGRVALA
ncbi:MAG: glutamyl-tRNA synthetase [Gaiellales bacterium]|jgi:glutamyl-tRNA synthetase|nr:glutamyl-tRNA synthetase [Gaiellales bacterium]MDX6550048.1 glutamyl-tRNA synthetase [Gaiellales bacterium]